MNNNNNNNFYELLIYDTYKDHGSFVSTHLYFTTIKKCLNFLTEKGELTDIFYEDENYAFGDLPKSENVLRNAKPKEISKYKIFIRLNGDYHYTKTVYKINQCKFVK